MKPNIVTGLVYEHTTMHPRVQRVDDGNTLLVFAEGENERLCQKLWSIEIWLGCSVHSGFDTATPEHDFGRGAMMGGKRTKYSEGR